MAECPGRQLDGSMVTQQDGVARPYSAKEQHQELLQYGNTFTNTVAISSGKPDLEYPVSPQRSE